MWDPWLKVSWMHILTSFSPQILLIIELEAGLAEGPRTATTPFDMIWHTETNKNGVEERRGKNGKRDTKLVSA